MIEALKRFAARAWAVSARVGGWIQRVLVVIALVGVYLVGVGLSRLLMALFARRRLALFSTDTPAGWLPAEGYGVGPDELRNQY